MKVASSLRLWLELQIKTPRPSGSVVRVNVSHMARTQSTGAELAAFDAPSTIDERWITETLAEVERVTVEDATEHGQTFQTYCLGVFRQRKPDYRCNRKLFRVRGLDEVAGSEAEAEDFDTEENEESDESLSDPRHIIAEMSRRITAMERHEESLVRSVIDDKGAAQKQQGRLIEQQGEQIAKLLTERAQMLESAEEIMTAKMDRELAAERERNRSMLLGELAQEVKLLAPAIIGKITGNPPEAKHSAQAESLRRFKESLKPEQLAGLAEKLSQPQQIALMEILSSIGETN